MSIRTLKDWQDGIREYAESKGFTWTKAEIDTMLLRLISEVCEAAEAARDIPIKKRIQLTFVHRKDGGEAPISVNVDLTSDGIFFDYIDVPFTGYDVLVRGKIIEEFEPDEHVAEELADTFIRLADMTKVLGIDLEEEVWEKHKKNLDRPPKHGRGRK